MSKSFLQPSWVKRTKSTRFRQLQKFYKGKDILDFGSAVGYKKEDWMHKHIKTIGRSIYGLDLDNQSVDEIRKMGFDLGGYWEICFGQCDLAYRTGRDGQ